MAARHRPESQIDDDGSLPVSAPGSFSARGRGPRPEAPHHGIHRFVSDVFLEHVSKLYERLPHADVPRIRSRFSVSSSTSCLMGSNIVI
jgi:hypothetical protein